MSLHKISYNNKLWYNCNDIYSRIGYSPYELKWPTNYIVISECRNELKLDDSDEYILETDILKWLEWKCTYQPDDKSIELQKELLSNSQ